MTRTVVDIEGKKYEVRRNHNKTHPCAGCCFFNDVTMIPTCSKDMPCLEFDYNSVYYHILKELQ